MLPMTPEMMLRAYAMGIFPMARSRDDPRLYWIDPDDRGILPLDQFHVPRSLRKFLKKEPFQVRVNTAFRAVMEACAQPAPDRPETWINEEILRIFCQLHEFGMAHSVECWHEGKLVGGLYGLALGGAFFGESMFSRTTDASKVALVHLVARLRRGGYSLLDTQFVTDHLSRFGAREIPRNTYLAHLSQAMEQGARFPVDEDVDWTLAL